MTKEAYVSYEIAKLLKEKGFCERCFMCYEQDGKVFEGFGNWNKVDIYIAAPTHQVACAWLREKGYHIYVDYNTKYNCWHRHIQETSTGIIWSLGGLKSHDDAIENAIKYSLEVLI